MKLNFFKIVSIAALCFSSTMAIGQYNGWKFNDKTHAKKDKLKLIQRLELGVHTSFSKDMFYLEVGNVVVNNVNGTPVSTQEQLYSFLGKASLSSVGGNLGLTLPVGKLTPKTTLGFNIDVYATFNSYKIKNFEVLGASALTAPKLNTTMVHVPLGLDVKWGGQSTLSKDDWASVGFGAGIAPTYITGPKSYSLDDKLVVTPYIKAEFGFFTGIFWKIKGMILFDHYNYGSIKEQTGGMYHNQGLYSTTNTFLLGLSFNLGSGGWHRSW